MTTSVNKMDKRILVTGAGGFLGSHIARHFGANGHRIAAVGRFNTTSDITSLYPNLWKLCGMTLPDTRFTDVIKEFQPDLIVHCAGTASVGDSVHDPYDDFQRTVEVCAFTLEAVRKYAPSCHFVLLSSAAVYGNPNQLPITEDTPCKPVSPYGYHKLMCEALVEEYSRLHAVNTTVLRIFSAYGERLAKQVVHDIARKFCDEKNEVVTLDGTGNETRDFIHAKDIARSIECLYNVSAYGVFNAASGVQTTIWELAASLKKYLKSTKEVCFSGKLREGDPLYWQADISRLSVTGFSQSISLEDGLKDYSSWFSALKRRNR